MKVGADGSREEEGGGGDIGVGHANIAGRDRALADAGLAVVGAMVRSSGSARIGRRRLVAVRTMGSILAPANRGTEGEEADQG